MSTEAQSLLTVADVAARWKVHPDTVRDAYGKVSGLRCVRIGRVVRFREVDVLKFEERKSK